MKMILALMLFVMQTVQCTTVEITETQQNVTVKLGDVVIIKLEENLTTGYSWQMDIPETDIVKVQENKYIASNTDLVGAGGVHKWNLKATTPGTVKITAAYRRPWEKNTPPARRFVCKITVE
ncbi:MAG: protease inhibitor I42 family protein [Alphaproteobacteria bacterium]|nr:protease inhibitor I42 family protein [Alphaproteobacteria bacterium]